MKNFVQAAIDPMNFSVATKSYGNIAKNDIGGKWEFAAARGSGVVMPVLLITIQLVNSDLRMKIIQGASRLPRQVGV